MTVTQLQYWEMPQWTITLACSANTLQAECTGYNSAQCQYAVSKLTIIAQHCGQGSRDLGNTHTGKPYAPKPGFPLKRGFFWLVCVQLSWHEWKRSKVYTSYLRKRQNIVMTYEACKFLPRAINKSPRLWELTVLKIECKMKTKSLKCELLHVFTLLQPYKQQF